MQTQCSDEQPNNTNSKKLIQTKSFIKVRYKKKINPIPFYLKNFVETKHVKHTIGNNHSFSDKRESISILNSKENTVSPSRQLEGTSSWNSEGCTLSCIRKRQSGSSGNAKPITAITSDLTSKKRSKPSTNSNLNLNRTMYVFCRCSFAVILFCSCLIEYAFLNVYRCSATKVSSRLRLSSIGASTGNSMTSIPTSNSRLNQYPYVFLLFYSFSFISNLRIGLILLFCSLLIM